MKTFLLLLALPLLAVQAANADDQLRNVQSQLKTEGFYYGDVNGQESPEMTAAIRRYQIRNGLEVTGSLNPETLHALGGSGAASKPAPPPQQPAASVQRKPTPSQTDRDFLNQEERKQPDASSQVVPPPAGPRPPDPSIVPPPAPSGAPAPGVDYSAVFAKTPYFNAPREVQQETLRRAQGFLAGRGFYREQVDGIPGPATEEALLTFQRDARLPLTGRLDMQTLGELRLLPGRGLGNPQLQPFYPNNAARDYRDGRNDRDYPPRRIYRGIQVD